MSRVVILIPPSEGKTPSGSGRSLEKVDKDVQVIYDRLMSFRGNFSQLLGVKGKALQAARLANTYILNSPTMPAIERYSGVVYNGIDYKSLPVKARIFLTAHVRIVSALFGLVVPDQPIPDYKLKIEKLDAAGYWKPLMAGKLAGCFVVDLLPQAHRKAVSYEQGIRVDFIVSKKGRHIPAGHQGKLIKGKFVRWLCEQAVTDPKVFKDFKMDGFQFDGRHFIRNM
jgi:cytoplasmic iron level regulating protein YaaA (DUF328/UPF0246 family)